MAEWWREFINIDPEIMGGKPVITGTRIPVETVVQAMNELDDWRDMSAHYPILDFDDIIAAMLFEIDMLRKEAEDRRASGWKPIDTAPKDNTRILLKIAVPERREQLYLSCGEVVYVEIHATEYVVIGRYDEKNVGGWAIDNLNVGLVEEHVLKWMPLPVPSGGK